MIDVLLKIEKELPELINSRQLHSMYIDYEKPYVSRVWFKYDEQYRVYLHKIEPCGEDASALYHPHPWKSAIRIVKGKYEMGVGHSVTDEIPVTDCKLILRGGAIYEMLEENAWHYVNPIDEPAYSIMVTGELNKRKMPIEPKKTFRELDEKEIGEILHFTVILPHLIAHL